MFFSYVGFVKDPLVDEANPLSTKYLHDLDLDLLEVIDRLEGLPKKVLRPKPLEFPALETSKNNRGATITNKMIKLEPGEVKREPDLNEGSSGRNNEVVLDELLSTREQIFGRRLPFYVDRYFHFPAQIYNMEAKSILASVFAICTTLE